MIGKFQVALLNTKDKVEYTSKKGSVIFDQSSEDTIYLLVASKNYENRFVTLYPASFEVIVKLQ
jgi:hypothetical protein